MLNESAININYFEYTYLVKKATFCANYAFLQYIHYVDYALCLLISFMNYKMLGPRIWQSLKQA